MCNLSLLVRIYGLLFGFIWFGLKIDWARGIRYHYVALCFVYNCLLSVIILIALLLINVILR
jgi:hypothetical protein